MSLRVALYTPAWPKGELPNGIVTYASNIIPALRDVGVEVFVIAGSIAPGCADPSVAVPEVARDPLAIRAASRVQEHFAPGASSERRNAMAIVKEVRRLRRERRIDVVEMEESFGWCGWVASRTDVPVITRLHGPWFLNGAMIEDTRTRSFRRRVRREGEAITRVAGVTAASLDVLERTRGHYALALPDAEVIYNPIPPVPETERWDPSAHESQTVLFVGRFDNHKAGDVAIEAFARIRSSQPEARLVFVGPDRGVTDAAGRSWGFHEFLADRLPKESDRAAVEWLGPQPPDVVTQLRRRAALTIVCSRYENFCYTLPEAMVQGCPVVATATGGLVELVEDGHNGLLVAPSDPDDLARGVLRLLSSPKLAARLAQRAAETIWGKLSPGAIASQTAAFYQRVLEMSSHR